MDNINILCKIGSYLPLKSLKNYLLVSKKINCDKLWYLYYTENYDSIKMVDSYYMKIKMLSLFRTVPEYFKISKTKIISIPNIGAIESNMNFNYFTLQNIKKLELYCVDEFIGNKFPQLTYLRLTSIQIFANNEIPNLEYLDLCYGSFRTLNLTPYKNLINLNVKQCNLRELYVLENKKLKYLEIIGSPITYINCYKSTVVVHDSNQHISSI